jgi:hypothetical protein
LRNKPILTIPDTFSQAKCRHAWLALRTARDEHATLLGGKRAENDRWGTNIRLVDALEHGRTELRPIADAIAEAEAERERMRAQAQAGQEDLRDEALENGDTEDGGEPSQDAPELGPEGDKNVQAPPPPPTEGEGDDAPMDS